MINRNGASRRRAGAANPTRASASTAARPGSAPHATQGGSPNGRHGKFNAAGEHVNGVWCASAAEAERYRQLLRMEMNGMIDNLVTQPKYDLIVNNRKITQYRADFSYDVITLGGQILRSVIEDVKGMLTPEFELKHKLFDALVTPALSLLHVKGKARHPDAPNEPGTTAGWMHKHWADRIPD